MDEGLPLGRIAVGAWVGGSSGIGHVLHWDDDLEVKLLGDPSVDDLALPLRTYQKPSYPLKWALRCGKTDPLKAGAATRGGWRRRGDRP